MSLSHSDVVQLVREAGVDLERVTTASREKHPKDLLVRAGLVVVDARNHGVPCAVSSVQGYSRSGVDTVNACVELIAAELATTVRHLHSMGVGETNDPVFVKSLIHKMVTQGVQEAFAKLMYATEGTIECVPEESGRASGGDA